MKIKIFQFQVIDSDTEANLNKVEEMFRETDLGSTDVVVLPEMWTSGYDLENIRDYAADNLEPVKSFIGRLAADNDVTVVAGSIPNTYGGSGVYNTAFTVNNNGELIYEYSKMHLVPMLNEPEFLESGDKPAEVFEINGEPAGQVICYDLRFPELFRDLSLSGAKIIFVVAEWPIERTEHWITLLKARAIENQCYIVASNTTGTQQNGTQFAGRSMIINPFGEILAEAAKDTEETVTAELDLNYIAKVRKDIPIFDSRRKELYKYL
ncbi:2-oxoglutaramate amidase [Jeotgalicoccus saudimassiliensis]|uniref:2-oxoglutaramate amidase n=1 Tax=Jeotgalicoccus saudimassiliensis TaxID=1461582 RepID=A0A078MCQ9_9STAP|nr:carbon-nitrogen family hydrolase [Jeotgalicoccus saudimassiliensis]CEA02516.1 2-oxoglutaramate amidase [Jeotgalicoccus saudimassiliensis]